jgi:cytosine/adenosine deaminase-related metal-dependent hydrolase
MKRFSSQYLFTNCGPVLKRGVITTDDEGMIIGINETGGELKEESQIEFYNGIIIPGFVNCHCHLELSHLKAIMSEGKGLPDFIEQLKFKRTADHAKILSSAEKADNEMFKAGISLCADICNTSDTFNLKRRSRIKYLNFIEVFGIDPSKTEKRMAEAMSLASEARRSGLEHFIVPHSPYSVSLPLLRMIRDYSFENKVSSIHFMETPSEKDFLRNHSGPIMEAYLRSGYLNGEPESAKDHNEVIINEITSSGKLILVHNTFADRETIEKVKRRQDLFWCLCPNSNLFLEGALPPVKLLMDEGCEIVAGTDSLASNTRLSILEEIKTLQLNFPWIRLEELVKWSTINGARALNKDKDFGSLEPGKKPGILLIENADLQNMRLTAESTVKRLI